MKSVSDRFMIPITLIDRVGWDVLEKVRTARDPILDQVEDQVMWPVLVELHGQRRKKE